MRPGQEPVLFTVEEMRDEWAQEWAPTVAAASPSQGPSADPGPGGARPTPEDAWLDWAARAELSSAEVQAAWVPPKVEDLRKAMLHCSGSAGFDGWSAG